MRISWLSFEQLTVARREFARLDADENANEQPSNWEQFFVGDELHFVPPTPGEFSTEEWLIIASHVARAERITEVLQREGLSAIRQSFGRTNYAVEAATIAAAAHFSDQLEIDDVLHVLRCSVDAFVFYANLLELLAAKTTPANSGESIATYRDFVDRYQVALAPYGFGRERIGAATDGLADFLVLKGSFDEADALFVRRHEEDSGDVAVALSASRAFLAAHALGRAAHWLDVASARAAALGRLEMAAKLAAKRDAIAKRLS